MFSKIQTFEELNAAYEAAVEATKQKYASQIETQFQARMAMWPHKPEGPSAQQLMEQEFDSLYAARLERFAELELPEFHETIEAGNWEGVTGMFDNYARLGLWDYTPVTGWLKDKGAEYLKSRGILELVAEYKAEHPEE